MLRLALVLGVFPYVASLAAAQPLAGALAIDERQGDQYGWAVDYETVGAAQARALSECGGGCRVVLTFNRCAAYAADQAADSTAVGWAESFASSSSAQQAALSECSSRGGTGCLVRVWGCNGPVVEEGLGLDRAARQQIQRGLHAAGFDPGGADGVFGPRTRSAIRGWQSSRGARATGYLNGTAAAALRIAPQGARTFREREPAGAETAAPAASAAQQSSPAASSELEVVFWQSIANSTNPVEFEAYLAQFRNGVFRALAEARLAAVSPDAGSRVPAIGAPTPGPRLAGSAAPSTGSAADRDLVRADAVFRPDRTCEGQPAGAACCRLRDPALCAVFRQHCVDRVLARLYGAVRSLVDRPRLRLLGPGRRLGDASHLEGGLAQRFAAAAPLLFVGRRRRLLPLDRPRRLVARPGPVFFLGPGSGRRVGRGAGGRIPRVAIRPHPSASLCLRHPVLHCARRARLRYSMRVRTCAAHLRGGGRFTRHPVALGPGSTSSVDRDGKTQRGAILDRHAGGFGLASNTDFLGAVRDRALGTRGGGEMIRHRAEIARAETEPQEIEPEKIRPSRGQVSWDFDYRPHDSHRIRCWGIQMNRVGGGS